MLVLGIESTCDETGFAVVRNGSEILSNVVASQGDLHTSYGGVIPELASRRHLDVCEPLLHQALLQAAVSMREIDLIAVAHGPGLVGALLVGINFAKGLAWSHEKPFIGVNHVEAHLFSSLMSHSPPLPSLGVVLSGGHTALLFVRGLGEYELIGQTQDDAIGEAFDKVAKMLDLPYPGGPEIEKLAREGNPLRYPLKAGTIKGRPYDFSFSGLKTAALYLIRGQNGQKNSPLMISEEDKKDVAASFQHVAFSHLVEKISLSAKEWGCQSVILGGGVVHNQYMRTLLEKKSSLPIYYPPAGLCLDNGAMIAGLGYHVFKREGISPWTLEAKPRIPFKESARAPTSASPTSPHVQLSGASSIQG